MALRLLAALLLALWPSLAAAREQEPIDPTAPPTPPTLAEPDVAARVAPAVVQVLTGDASAEGRASGVKIAAGIVTNDHVVGDAERVEIVAADGRRGTAVVARRAAALDLVLLRTDLELPAVELEGVGQQRPGETVLVLGYPRPDALGPGGEVTLSRGLISAIRRDHEGVTYIQTDAAANPGSSGGAMVNLRARLVGIPTFGVRGGQSLNFAISADAIQTLLDTPPASPSPTEPLFHGDPRAILLAPDVLGPEWETARGPTGPRAGPAGERAGPAPVATQLVRGDPTGSDPEFAALLSLAWVEPDVPRAQLLWERTVRHAPGGLTRLPDPNVGDTCRAYRHAESGLAELYVFCREQNVVVAVVIEGTPDLATYDAIAYYSGIVTERVRNGST